MSELEAYRQGREALLASLATSLAADERVVAAWLTGSYAHGDADAVSDIDVTVVIADEHAAALCRRDEMVTAWPPAERLALFARFGQPANVHENNYNAPEGGTFTSVLYQPPAHVVDWILVPHALARRPDTARVLFERRPVAPAPPPEPLSPDALAARVSEQIAFFWMMAAVTVKYLVRGDLGFVVHWLDELSLLALHVESQLAGQLWRYRRELIRRLPPATTAGELATAMSDLCSQVEGVMGVAGEKGIALRPAPREAIEALMRLRPADRPADVLEELLAQVTPENLQDEVDWGAPMGQEAW